MKFLRVLRSGSLLLVLAAAAACHAQVRSKPTADSGSVLTAAAKQNLLNSVQLHAPELAGVERARARGDDGLALSELARYYRTRNSVAWQSSALSGGALPAQVHATADAAVVGTLQGGVVPLRHTFPSGAVDWHFDATTNTPGQAPNPEWQWQLNRMAFWSDLARTYCATGDERYAKAFASELRSWLIQNPPPDHMDNRVGSTWRTIEVGIRAYNSWMDAFYAFRDSPSLTDDELLAMVNAFLEQGRYLRRFHTKNNWLNMEMAGLYAIGAEFPEFKEAKDWRNFAAKSLFREGHDQFLPDGAQRELSTGYQEGAIEDILRIANISRWTDHESELPAGYIAQMKRAFQYEVDISAPDRMLPKVNDSWPVSVPQVARIALKYFPNDEVFQWFATDGKQGNPPPFTSTFLNRSGMVAMRSSWSRDANYLLLRAGPLGMGHQEQEALDVQIWAHGREMISNGGGGSYEKSKWRAYGTSAYSHSTVVVDGLAEDEPLDQRDPEHDPDQKSQGPIDVDWQSNPLYDFASKDYDQGYGSSHLRIARDRREVLFLKPDLFIVSDRLFPSDSRSHQYQARWQLLTTKIRLDPTTGILETADPGSSNLVVVPLLKRNSLVQAISAQQTPELLGWEVRKDVTPQAVPATTLMQIVTGSGPQLILTMFVPIRANQRNPVSRVEPGVDGISATVVFNDGRKLIIACPGSFGMKIQKVAQNGDRGASINVGQR